MQGFGDSDKVNTGVWLPIGFRGSHLEGDIAPLRLSSRQLLRAWVLGDHSGVALCYRCCRLTAAFRQSDKQ